MASTPAIWHAPLLFGDNPIRFVCGTADALTLVPIGNPVRTVSVGFIEAWSEGVSGPNQRRVVQLPGRDPHVIAGPC